MNKEALQTWVAALRSGKYKQTTHQLHSVDKTSFCCLGVANEVFNCGKTNCSQTYNNIYDSLGFSIEDRSRIGSVLVAMNDYHEKTFNEIADYIETELLPKAEASACGS